MKPITQLGATPRNLNDDRCGGVDFVLYSASARSVRVAVYDSATCKLKSIGTLNKKHNQVWQCFVENAGVGDYYVYHVSLENQLKVGRYLNYRHGLLDPYARKIVATEQRCGLPELVGEICGVNDLNREIGKPFVPWSETVIYEAHVKGLTMLHPDIPEDLRGTYMGVCHPAVISHLKSLGITTLELMPCQAMLDEPWLAQKGLTNYWGYNPVSFMAPTSRFAIEDSVSEFKAMVDALHAENIEVVVDLVFNHTAEGDFSGPVISMKGIDPFSYYLIDDNINEPFINYTGCGNTVNAIHPRVVQLWMDSMRVWYNELGVDGFRFDLGVTLGRNGEHFDKNHPFFVAVQQDPDLQNAKLIFEPWDLGPNGYQVGQFPPEWAEWNGGFRDVVRSYIRGDGGAIQEFTTQLVSPFDTQFQHKDRSETSINFVTAHDGFTLHDLVSYQEKHNKANGEHNRDGCNHNISRNYGVEGETNQEIVRRLRQQQKRNFMAVVALARGIPMLLMGDELGRSQRGNNNAYCQDNEISWYSWTIDPEKDLREFWQRMVALRREFSWIFAADTEIHWYRPDARLMARDDWEKWYARSVGCSFCRHDDEQLFVVFNMHDGELEYRFPGCEHQDEPQVELTHFLFDTAKAESFDEKVTLTRASYVASPHSIVALHMRRKEEK